MAEELEFQTLEGGKINEVFFKKVVKGIPSLVTTFNLYNDSDTLTFEGEIFVAPAFGSGRSYSDDVSISNNGEVWFRRLTLTIPPSSSTELKMRVLPLSTPADVSGRAALKLQGNWG